jgi:hypothetical protein
MCGSPKCRKSISSLDWLKDKFVDELGMEYLWPHVRRRVLLWRERRERMMRELPKDEL